jgi:ribosomal protein S18 acetylase RimI-like enzyme
MCGRSEKRGRALLDHAVTALGADGVRAVYVLTRAESEPQEGTDTYAGTRAFYRRNGFLDVCELRPPGWVQTALLLVRPLTVPS